MRFIFTEKKVQVSDDVRAYAEKKIGKLDRFFRTESDAYVTFSKERATIAIRRGEKETEAHIQEIIALINEE